MREMNCSGGYLVAIAAAEPPQSSIFMHLLIANRSSFLIVAAALIFDAAAISSIASTIASPVTLRLLLRRPEFSAPDRCLPCPSNMFMSSAEPEEPSSSTKAGSADMLIPSV
nr:hypothetical protein Iba_chr11eCG4500 [Ipomoea batatas]